MRWVEHLLALARWKRVIFFNTLVVAAGSVVVALLLPKWYQSTASVFPPEDESFSLGSLSSMVAMQALGGARTQLPVWGSPTDVYAAILSSRTIGEAIVEQFDLQTRYETDSMDATLAVLDGCVRIDVGAEGILYITVEDKDPQMAADLANAFVDQLDRVNREKRATSGGRARQFVEVRLRQNQAELAAAEDSLLALQDRTGLMEPTEQARSAIRAGADLEVQIVLKEVELGVLQAQIGSPHPERIRLEREIAELKDRARELDAGGGTIDTRFEIPISDYPGLSLEYLRRVREVKVQETIFEFLVQQYEQFKIQETRDTPTLYRLDVAKPAEQKIRPIRWLLCVTATLIGFAVSVAVAVVLESLRALRVNSPAQFDRLAQLAGEVGMRRWVERLR